MRKLAPCSSGIALLVLASPFSSNEPAVLRQDEPHYKLLVICLASPTKLLRRLHAKHIVRMRQKGGAVHLREPRNFVETSGPIGKGRRLAPFLAGLHV